MFKRLTVTLTTFAMICATSLLAEPVAVPIAHVTWEPSVDGFGGLSGLEVSKDGSSFVSVSDDGVLYRGDFVRASDGTLLKASLIETIPLVVDTGLRPDEKRERDMEGLAIADNGAFHVSVENKFRILSYPDARSTPTFRGLPTFKTKTPKNTGFEALALTSNGDFIALREGSPNIRTPYDIYQSNQAGSWDVVYQLPRRGRFRPVGADFGPDGHLYVLTRAFNGFGFAAQIYQIRYKKGAPTDHTLVYSGTFGQFDNLEGLAVWRDDADEIRMVAISDDNFSAAQSTIIVEFRLQD
jgi:hypothetical protein